MPESITLRQSTPPWPVRCPYCEVAATSVQVAVTGEPEPLNRTQTTEEAPGEAAELRVISRVDSVDVVGLRCHSCGAWWSL